MPISAETQSNSVPAAREDLPLFRQIPGHHSPTPFYLTADMFGGLPLEVAGGEISELVGKPVAAPHTHEVPEIYLLMSPTPGGAVIDVVADDKHYVLTSPATFFIPAGTVHHFVTRVAQPGSYCLGVLLTGSGPGSPATRPEAGDLLVDDGGE
ncbi:cupin domain-containing protein [Micromonospora orduensis]|uniref:Cupin domain-containing protein n=1 Tax=Micromonospora orduensis TaxID=1420891 RepID=A0A5C4QEL7_9ACTN|nr:cupin domain-containing protein [Micromonospora orduensis]TNH22687.1 cupin domain-containing protein [Micromonospora orduensis]